VFWAYQVGISLYAFAEKVAALFSERAAKRIEMQQKPYPRLEKRPIWIHCASLGEFQQALPLIRSVKSTFPENPLLLSFFSPSGFFSERPAKEADYVVALPVDTPRAMRRFIQHFRPAVGVLIKSETWLNMMRICNKEQIPLLACCVFHNSTAFWQKSMGKAWLRELQQFKGIGWQDEYSSRTVRASSISKISFVSGDFRVKSCMDKVPPATENSFLTGKYSQVLVAGSIYEHDIPALIRLSRYLGDRWKILLFPHEINESTISAISDKWTDTPPVRFSLADKEVISNSRVVLVDTIGMLAESYRKANLAYVGAKNNKKIHSVLEPAAYGIPLVIGPNFSNSREAIAFVVNNWAYSYRNFTEFDPTNEAWTKFVSTLPEISESLKIWMLSESNRAEQGLQQALQIIRQNMRE
jgi:3-deoxy-D-manno-octulosonic-acid transferase